jgi:cyclase
VLYGAGGGQAAGNVLVLLGAEGALVVDTGYPQFVPKYKEAIASLGGRTITHAINTHWHDDHSEGNKVLGPDGALIVAHDNARTMLLRDNKINVVRTILDQPAFPPAALPVITFDDRIELYFADERLELVHVAPAHTAGDVAVILRGRNIMHTGDVFLSAAYPFSDIDNGGDFDGELEFCRALLEGIDRDTIIVPGHGRNATYAELEAYIAMLETVRGRLVGLIAAGATLAQVVAAQPTKEFDATYGNPTTYFLDRAYKSLGGRAP